MLFLFICCLVCFFFSQLGCSGRSAAQLAGLDQWLLEEAASGLCPFQQTQQWDTRISPALTAFHVGRRWEHFWSGVFMVLKQRVVSSYSIMTPLTGAWWAPRDLKEPRTWQKKTVMMWDVERLALKTRRTGICGTQCPDCVLNRKPNVFLCITFSYKNILWSSGETKQNISVSTHCHLMKAKYVTLD